MDSCWLGYLLLRPQKGLKLFVDEIQLNVQRVIPTDANLLNELPDKHLLALNAAIAMTNSGILALSLIFCFSTFFLII